ncbi:MAG: acyl-CoA dehydrogenase [Bacteroidetes bacterium]|nr:acyl-CoA dehydrogenase [Bacteroidota bacterium]
MSSTTTATAQILRGGEFLVKDSQPADTFIREELNDEQRMIADTVLQFVETEIAPNADRIDAMEPGLLQALLDKSAELGLTAMAIPEEYGGYGKDFITNTLITEMTGMGHSFSVSFGAHTGIGTLPIVYYGNEAQKQKYLPKLATAEWKAAYCLTEPGSGSDALAAKTRADLSADGTHYLLNGQKMWITNAGFADVFIVFAKIDGDKFTGFIVERSWPGLSVGAEEKKMGIKGSSTRQVFFENVKVPVENVLGDIGQGHKIAFNILNVGRIKLCAGVVGGAKQAAAAAVRYANERQQFGRSISEFGAIKHKLGEMAVRTFSAESACYRATAWIDQKERTLLAEGADYGTALLGAAEEYAIECAMLKVIGSETVDYVVDELVQVHGGYGYSEEYPAARAYRDSRINRIFEGTNEINRMLTIDMMLRRAMSGQVGFLQAAMGVQQELMGMPDLSADSSEPFAAETAAVSGFKKACLAVVGFAGQKLGKRLAAEQELLLWMADMLNDTFVAESTLLRVRKLVESGQEPADGPRVAIARLFIHDATERIRVNGNKVVTAFAEGDEARMLLLALKRFSKYPPMDTVRARRAVAQAMIDANGYVY